GGTVTLATSANTDAASVADGSATDGDKAAIGAAVALTISNVDNHAIVPHTLTITANALTVSATVTPKGTDVTSTVSAIASSGAAGGVAIAGSVAIAVVNQDTLAALYGTVLLSGGDAVLASASSVEST